MRLPSDLCNLNHSDIKIDDKRESIIKTETKKHGNKRTPIPERFILVSPNRKSLKNYIEKWRPQIDNGIGTVLFLTPEGK